MPSVHGRRQDHTVLPSRNGRSDSGFFSPALPGSPAQPTPSAPTSQWPPVTAVATDASGSVASLAPSTASSSSPATALSSASSLGQSNGSPSPSSAVAPSSTQSTASSDSSSSTDTQSTDSSPPATSTKNSGTDHYTSHSKSDTASLRSSATTFQGTADGSQSDTALMPLVTSKPLSSITPTTVSSASNSQTLNTNGTKTTIIAGVVGGVGGLILLAMLGLFFCVRRRRRKHAKEKMLDWPTVRPSMFRAPSNSNRPRTPKSSHSTHSDSPLSPSLSQMTHSSSQYATAQENMYSPTRPGTARTNISPLLIVQVPPSSAESYHGHGEEPDPFADPLAMARLRPRIGDASPTIRVSDTTLVDQAWAAKGAAPPTKMGLEPAGPDALLMPPPPLNPADGRPNRLSNDSLQPGFQEEDPAYAGLAM